MMTILNGLNLSAFHPNEGDTIVVTYDKALISPIQVHDSFELIREEYPDHIVILVPKGMTLSAK